MKRFILKASLFVAVPVVINLLVGLIRLHVGDKNFPYIAHKLLAVKHDYKGHPYETQYLNRRKNLKYGYINHIKNNLDEYGFSDQLPNNKPDIVFIGDSYFSDMLISSDSGIQATCNRMLGYNASYCAGFPGSSDFSRYNEIIKKSAFTNPKVIIFEIDEMNLHKWMQLKDGLLRSYEVNREEN